MRQSRAGLRASREKWRKANPEKQKAYQRAKEKRHYLKNIDRIHARMATYRAVPANKEKNKAYQKAWYAAHKDQKKQSTRQRILRKKYGLTPAAFLQLMASQNYRCVICGRPLADNGRTHVDHDHVTGRTRSLLCCTCNQGIGLFHESPDSLRAAADYVERHMVLLRSA